MTCDKRNTFLWGVRVSLHLTSMQTTFLLDLNYFPYLCDEASLLWKRLFPVCLRKCSVIGKSQLGNFGGSFQKGIHDAGCLFVFTLPFLIYTLSPSSSFSMADFKTLCTGVTQLNFPSSLACTCQSDSSGDHTFLPLIPRWLIRCFAVWVTCVFTHMKQPLWSFVRHSQ